MSEQETKAGESLVVEILIVTEPGGHRVVLRMGDGEIIGSSPVYRDAAVASLLAARLARQARVAIEDRP